MQKIRNKILSVFLACTLLFGSIPISLYATNTDKNITENTIETHTTSDTNENISINESYVSAIRVKELIDGLAPFDSDNNPGNDANASNGIVRSFDNINYTLEYVTELKNNNPIEEAYLMIEFTLPCTKDIATFDMDTMAWIIDPKLTEENGVQKLTGKRLLQNTGGTTSVPGQGILSTGIKVQAAPNGTIIQPTFKLWMEGNELSEAKSINNSKTTVSAALKYNIQILNSSGLNFIGHYDFTAGNTTLTPNSNSHYGRAKGYSIALSLYNDNAAKELKGIELPSGDITFDITMKSEVNGVDKTFDKDYGVKLWDYNMNNAGSTGKLGRVMNLGNSQSYAYYAPANKGGNEASCYDGGNIKLIQDSSRSNLFHVTISNYKFDPEFTFPTRYMWSNAGTVIYTANIGNFAAENIQFISLFPTTVNQTSTIYQDIQISNIKIKSVSNQNGQEMITTDNRQRQAITLYPSGSLSKYQRYTKTYSAGTYLSTTYYSGDNAAYRGNNINIYSFPHGTCEFSWTDFNLLQKFDDEGLEPTGQYKTISHAYNGSGNCTVLWAAKPDKTGWTSDTEMNHTKEENLIFFDNLQTLKNNGYTCVGVLYEMRDFKSIPTSSESTYWELWCNVNIKSTAKTNAVYQTVSEIRGFREGISETDFTWKSIKNGDHYGFATGKLPSTYTKNFSYVYTNDNYEKMQYNDGVQWGHTGGYLYGNSLLILDYKTRITSEITDISPETNSVKTTYDMDANERIVNYRINPSTVIESSNNNPSSSSQSKTNVKIKVTLPKDLKYNINSASLQPDEINYNDDGTSELIWYYKNVTIGETYNSIGFNCTIGKAGTNDDVINNQQITMTAEITGDGDARGTTLQNGNKSEKMLTIIKLNAVSISKETDTPFVSIGQNFNYNFKFANNSENKISNAKLYDVLPYVGDGRNSKFSGTYNINSITVDFSNAPKTFESFKNNSNALQYATDLSAKNNNFSSINSFKNWITVANKSVNTNAKTITYTNLPAGIVALAINTDLEGFEYIDINLSMSGSGQKEGDVYVNSIFQNADGQLKEVNSNRAAVQIYGSLEVTKIWDDQNNEYNTRPSTLKITVYQDNNIYKELTLSSTDKVGTDNNTWRQRIANVPLYKIDGTPYIYTIQEDTSNTSLRYFYDSPIYNQNTLTVTNTAQFIPTDPNGLKTSYKIIIHKDIVDENNNIADAEDFEQVALDVNNTYNFAITLKELNRIVTNNGTTLSEVYNGYSGNLINGIVTNKGDLIFDLGENGSGKYEISENVNQYFDFIDIEKLNDEFNTSGASFSKENGKYYITLSGLTGQFEQISVKVTNQIRPDRPYNETEDKINIFKN